MEVIGEKGGRGEETHLQHPKQRPSSQLAGRKRRTSRQNGGGRMRSGRTCFRVLVWFVGWVGFGFETERVKWVRGVCVVFNKWLDISMMCVCGNEGIGRVVDSFVP